MSDLDLPNPDRLPESSKPESPFRPVSNADELSGSPAPKTPAEGAPPAPPQGPEGATPPVPWKGAASSVPKLRQQPAALPEPAAASGEFQGFAQDAPAARGASAIGEGWEDEEGSGPAIREDTRSSPLRAEVPVWEEWLERARALSRPAQIGVAAGVLLLLLIVIMIPKGEPSVPLARIRQHPEAFDGRTVKVEGRAGETFRVGGSYVFDLRQGHDTIVVYSQTRHPGLHDRVEAKGLVSIGYLDGAPRVALFEQGATP